VRVRWEFRSAAWWLIAFGAEASGGLVLRPTHTQAFGDGKNDLGYARIHKILGWAGFERKSLAAFLSRDREHRCRLSATA